MNVTQIYKLAIQKGIEADFRSRKQIEAVLARRRNAYEKLSENEKEAFDTENFSNPYSDTRILHLADDRPVKKALSGIDIDVEELLLSKHIKDIDLVISHHPEGRALADLSSVMELQVDLLHRYGVPVHIADNLLRERASEVSRGISPINHNKTVDAARLLGINFMCVHTPADNLAARFLDREIKKGKPEFVGELLDLLRKIPEYKEAARIAVGPRLIAGAPDRRVGKIGLTEVTGGTEGSTQIYEVLSRAGVGTVVGMHMSEDHKKEAEKAHINVVIAGHISSDSIGMNLFLDELEKRGIEIVACSGLIRVSRAKKKKK